MGNKLFLVIVGAFIVVVILFGLDKCGQSGRLKEVQGEKKVLKGMLKIQTETSMDTISDKNKEIADANLTIKKLKSTIADKNEKLAVKDAEITGVEEAYDETAPAEERVANLKKQVELWRGKFQIAEQIIAEKDEIIFSLAEKYDAQKVISNEYKGLYESTLDLNKILDFENTLLKRKALKLKLISHTKTTFILAAIGYLVYSVVKD